MHTNNIAVEKESDWALPYAGLVKIWGARGQFNYVPPDVALPLVYDNLYKALELDPGFGGSQFTNALIGVWAEWDWRRGKRIQESHFY